jgi:hypothetical protein
MLTCWQFVAMVTRILLNNNHKSHTNEAYRGIILLDFEVLAAVL